MTIDFNNLTWSCHICGEIRPDAKISVATHDLDFPGFHPGQLTENVRYCNDREHCRSEADKGPRTKLPEND